MYQSYTKCPDCYRTHFLMSAVYTIQDKYNGVNTTKHMTLQVLLEGDMSQHSRRQPATFLWKSPIWSGAREENTSRFQICSILATSQSDWGGGGPCQVVQASVYKEFIAKNYSPGLCSLYNYLPTIFLKISALAEVLYLASYGDNCVTTKSEIKAIWLVHIGQSCDSYRKTYKLTALTFVCLVWLSHSTTRRWESLKTCTTHDNNVYEMNKLPSMTHFVHVSQVCLSSFTRTITITWVSFDSVNTCVNLTWWFFLLHSHSQDSREIPEQEQWRRKDNLLKYVWENNRNYFSLWDNNLWHIDDSLQKFFGNLPMTLW